MPSRASDSTVILNSRGRGERECDKGGGTCMYVVCEELCRIHLLFSTLLLHTPPHAPPIH